MGWRPIIVHQYTSSSGSTGTIRSEGKPPLGYHVLIKTSLTGWYFCMWYHFWRFLKIYFVRAYQTHSYRSCQATGTSENIWGYIKVEKRSSNDDWLIDWVEVLRPVSIEPIFRARTYINLFSPWWGFLMNETWRKPTTRTQCLTLFHQWNGIFYMPSYRHSYIPRPFITQLLPTGGKAGQFPAWDRLEEPMTCRSTVDHTDQLLLPLDCAFVIASSHTKTHLDKVKGRNSCLLNIILVNMHASTQMSTFVNND